MKKGTVIALVATPVLVALVVAGGVALHRHSKKKAGSVSSFFDELGGSRNTGTLLGGLLGGHLSGSHSSSSDQTSEPDEESDDATTDDSGSEGDEEEDDS